MQTMKLLVIIMLLSVIVLSACGSGEVVIPTVDVELVRTLAVMTYQAQLTQTAFVLPSATPLPTNTPIPIVTFSSPGGSENTANTPPSNENSQDCYGLAYVKDITIPDNTPVTPGQSFTKTWLVSNNGTCDWEPGFIFNVVGGDVMNGVAVTLNQTVQPGRQYEFSVPMVVPTDATGELKGTWQLSDTNGNFFGQGVYVLVDVASGTPAPTDTPIPTATGHTIVAIML